jgi:ribulose 1,5-bisphosphate synthetase/thiazole synthase
MSTNSNKKLEGKVALVTGGTRTAEFIERVRANQQKLTSDLSSQYDFIVCGSGSSGSVVARRLAENPRRQRAPDRSGRVR